MEELNKIDKKVLFQAPQNIAEIIENKFHSKILTRLKKLLKG